MSHTASLIILAGGASRRMGHPKHLLTTPGGTLIERIAENLSPLFAETLLVGRNEEQIPAGVRFVEDVRPERSPLVGIYSGLCAATGGTCVVIGCDMPFVMPALLRELLECSNQSDVVVPVVNGFYEPLLAVYRRSRSCIEAIERALDAKRFKVTSFYSEVAVREIPESVVRRIDPDLLSFTNINTPKQLPLLAQL
ncbi:molybdenum cofactor guanylyltransferase [Candidatus Bipolaricaulota bacterium]|nr:molybdenum cofactor guanylyltransferase [Candidatus Bipolaricaulota bacterium]